MFSRLKTLLHKETLQSSRSQINRPWLNLQALQWSGQLGTFIVAIVFLIKLYIFLNVFGASKSPSFSTKFRLVSLFFFHLVVDDQTFFLNLHTLVICEEKPKKKKTSVFCSFCLPGVPFSSEPWSSDDVCCGSLGSPGNSSWIRRCSTLQMCVRNKNCFVVFWKAYQRCIKCVVKIHEFCVKLCHLGVGFYNTCLLRSTFPPPLKQASGWFVEYLKFQLVVHWYISGSVVKYIIACKWQ